MPELLLSVIFGLMSMVPMGLGSAVSPIVTKRIGVRRVMLWRNLATSFLLLIVFLLTLKTANFDIRYIGVALLLSLFAYSALAFYFKALSMGKIGLISPTTSTNVILSVSLSALFLGAVITHLQMLFIALIILGTILIAFNLKDLSRSSIFKKSSGVPYAFVTAILWGLFFFLAQIPLQHLGIYFTAFLFELGMLFFTFIHLLITNETFAVPSYSDLKIIWRIALLNVVSIIGLYVGLAIANVGIVLTLSAATPLVIALYGRFVFKEKLSKLQYAAIALILIGIVCLSYFK